MKLYPSKVKVKSGKFSLAAQSMVYWPFQDFSAPIWAFKISANWEGRAIKEVPVSMAAPWPSKTAYSSPKPIPSNLTSQ